MYGDADVRRYELKVQQAFTCASTPTVWPGSVLRSYVPRLPRAGYPLATWPNAAGVITTVYSGSFGADCGVTDWNGDRIPLCHRNRMAVLLRRNLWPVKKAGNQPAGCAIPANAPTSVVITTGTGSATVAFGAPASNGGSSITSYLVTATRVASGAAITKSGAISPITVTGLAHGAAYKVSA